MKNQKLDAGVMITASHNPSEYNGVKFKNPLGAPFQLRETMKIEWLLGNDLVQVDEDRIDIQDYSEEYYNHVDNLIDFDAINKAGLNILVDSMGGACQQFVQNILSRHNILCKTISQIPENHFGGRLPEPIERNLEPLRTELLKGSYSAGFALDGDGDRLGVMTENGDWVNNQEVILLLTDYIVNHKKLPGDIIKTCAVTDKLKILLNDEQRNIIDVPVGHRFVSEKMMTNNAAFGCTENGGYIFSIHVPDRDGIISTLILIELLANSGHKSIGALLEEKRTTWGNIYFKRADFNLNNYSPTQKLKALTETPLEIISYFNVVRFQELYNENKLLNGIKYTLEGTARWLLIRVSETEPLIRIYAEGENQQEVEMLCEAGRELIQSEKLLFAEA